MKNSSSHEHHEHHPHKKEHAVHAPGVTWDDISPEEEKVINDGLAAIYGDDREDLGKLEKAGSRVTRYLVRGVIVLAVLALVSYLGYFVYLRFFSSPAEDPLFVSIEAPTEVVSGTASTVTVRYANAGTVPLASLSVDVNLPDAFIVSSMTPEPTNTEELVWSIGSVERKGEGTIVFEGTWVADVPSTKSLQALSTYRPANFNSNFDDVATLQVTTLTSNLTLTATGPEAARPGETVTYDFAVENKGSTTFSGVVFSATLPDGFYLDSSTPALEPAAPTEWLLGDLAPTAVQHVMIVGSYASDISDVQSMTAHVASTQGDDELTQGEATVFTDVEGNGLVIQLVGNGSADDVTMDPGDPLRLTVGYKNTGEQMLSGVSLLVDFQADGKVPITWNEATLDGGRLTQDGIRFDDLSLAVGEDKMKNLIFPVREELAVGEVQEWNIIIHATLNGVTVKSQPLKISLNSDASFASAARYYDDNGAPVGEGPLPPTEGETTTYEVVWTLTNELHALSDIRASATLPPGVTWFSGDAEYGEVAYDESTRVVTWTIAAAPANLGMVQAIMTVSITPDDDDVGKFMKLLSGTSFRATDTTTNSTVQRTTEALTTECEGDEYADGKGVITQ